jgi:hypothetical protein
VLDDQRRAGDAVAGQQLVALVARRRQRQPSSKTVRRGRATRRPGSVGRRRGELRQPQRLDLDHGHHAQRHHLARLVAEGVAVDLLVDIVEAVDDRSRARRSKRPSGMSARSSKPWPT